MQPEPGDRREGGLNRLEEAHRAQQVDLEVAAEIGTIVPQRLIHDYAGALLRFDNGARGSFWVTQAAAGVAAGLAEPDADGVPAGLAAAGFGFFGLAGVASATRCRSSCWTS
mgnify:CR=1 FL=1